MPADAQFQLKARYPANLDRCRRCGVPRIMHASDGSCGLSLTLGHRGPSTLVKLSGLLAVLCGAAWLLATSPAINAGSMLAFAVLVVLVSAAAAMTLSRRS